MHEGTGRLNGGPHGWVDPLYRDIERDGGLIQSIFVLLGREVRGRLPESLLDLRDPGDRGDRLDRSPGSKGTEDRLARRRELLELPRCRDGELDRPDVRLTTYMKSDVPLTMRSQDPEAEALLDAQHRKGQLVDTLEAIAIRRGIVAASGCQA